MMEHMPNKLDNEEQKTPEIRALGEDDEDEEDDEAAPLSEEELKQA